jgi:hypothetical protein|tara:strand:+ start:165 stop:326 length:162 start_codon:yes stop_codon:yes gene_type:complete
MPLLIYIAELGFSWPSFDRGLYWVVLGLELLFLPLQEQLMIYTLFPTKSVLLI